jgi:hypothetical protein
MLPACTLHLDAMYRNPTYVCVNLALGCDFTEQNLFIWILYVLLCQGKFSTSLYTVHSH